MQPEPEKMEVEEPKKEEKKSEIAMNQDWISRLQSHLMAAQKK